MQETKKIYYLSVFNRARSQIAEAFTKKYGGERVSVESAGVDGAKDVHPLTIEVMKEVGIDISQNRSKTINMKKFVDSDVIVKLCEEAHERCPIVPFGIQQNNGILKTQLTPMRLKQTLSDFVAFETKSKPA
nr:arsenate reductase ArsC [Alicyclobacillus tolerans]